MEPDLPDCDAEDCFSYAGFRIYGRWRDEDGTVTESKATVCGRCIREVGPKETEQAYADYQFEITMYPNAFDSLPPQNST